ncbi:L-sorbose 1-dehydrogenase-like [Oppia nitens]|uniref:L-sorbose 1-dehydrogenase-like n=1 Tax=Oppia nitens TaxID=1686743 RepID=UPI0023DC3A0A|nr:L-sorbose 1-dehydrogenase-like [Oppia nitens]
MTYSLLALVLQRDARHRSQCERREWLDRYHYIVVGSGSAGAIVAKRLAEENSRVNVLLLESGGAGDLRTDIPTMYPWLMGTDYDWNYMSEPQQHMGLAYVDRRQTEPRGRLVGGSSAINFLVYNRGNRRDYDRWDREFGAKGWNYDSVLPFFIKSENNTDSDVVRANPGMHGTDGPIGVSSIAVAATPLDRALVAYQQVLNDLELETIDLNGPKQLGTGLIQFTIKDNLRSSTASAYLMDNVDNLHILCRAHVTRVLFSGRTAIGVEFVRYGQKYKVFADFEVILSAGAIGSPHLLMLSGVGPKAHLKSLDIQCVADLPVGDHLKDHIVVPFYFLLANDTTNSSTDSLLPPDLTGQHVYDFFANQSGSLIQFPKMLTYYSTSLNKEPDYPDTCIYSWIENYLNDPRKMAASFDRSVRADWESYYRQFHNRRYFYAAASVVRINSKGYVRLRSTDPFESPLIDPKYLSDKRDLQAFVEIIKFFYYIVEKTQFSRYVVLPRPIPGCKYCYDRPLHECDTYITCLIRQIGLRDYHLGGACRMGDPKRDDTVLDDKLRVKGVHRLRVVDSSVMPDMVNANTQAVSMMIGEMGAHLIKQYNRPALNNQISQSS